MCFDLLSERRQSTLFQILLLFSGLFVVVFNPGAASETKLCSFGLNKRREITALGKNAKDTTKT